MSLKETLKQIQEENHSMGIESRLFGSLKRIKEEFKQEALQEIHAMLSKMIQERMMKIRVPKDGKDGLPGTTGKAGKDAMLEPNAIRDALQSLTGENRLDASAIKNLMQEIPEKLGRQISGSGAGSFIIGETPTGAVNGSNTTFTLAQSPRPGTVMLYVGGIRMTGGGEDYTISGLTITTNTAPPSGAIIRVDYEKA